MQVPKRSDLIHKTWLYRILDGIASDIFLVKNLRFKGGTCAAMQGYIDRFSVDLDFDLLDPNLNNETKKHLEKLFKNLGLKIDDQSAKVPQYFLKYDNAPNERNTIEFDVTFPAPKSNNYEPVVFTEIDRILHCQTIETMFANKLVAVLDRYKRHKSIAGRDFFDIHTFFLKGFNYDIAVIEERTGTTSTLFLKELKDFITNHVNQTVIDQDLNVLLPNEQFQKIRKTLIKEVIMFL